MADETNKGFDHTEYKDEVIDRWGKEAYERSDSWYRSLTADGKKRFQQEQVDIASDFAKAKSTGESPDGETAQEIARRQFDWIKMAWQSQPSAEAFSGLGQMYVDDPRFTANYDKHGSGTAEFVRDAMTVYAERNLE